MRLRLVCSKSAGETFSEPQTPRGITVGDAPESTRETRVHPRHRRSDRHHLPRLSPPLSALARVHPRRRAIEGASKMSTDLVYFPAARAMLGIGNNGSLKRLCRAHGVQ